MCKFKGIGETEVSSRKARKIGAKPGQDVKEMKIEDGPLVFQLFVWLVRAD